MKLILCANRRQEPGYMHHDVLNLPGIDYKCELFKIGEFVPEGTCEEVQFTHALEHFPKKETQKVLGLLKGLLSEGGKLYLEVPNFIWQAKILLEGRERDAVYYCFGGQLDEYDFHKTGFTPKIIKEELEKAGFKDINIQDGSSLCVWASK